MRSDAAVGTVAPMPGRRSEEPAPVAANRSPSPSAMRVSVRLVDHRPIVIGGVEDPPSRSARVDAPSSADERDHQRRPEDRKHPDPDLRQTGSQQQPANEATDKCSGDAGGHRPKHSERRRTGDEETANGAYYQAEEREDDEEPHHRLGPHAPLGSLADHGGNVRPRPGLRRCSSATAWTGAIRSSATPPRQRGRESTSMARSRPGRGCLSHPALPAIGSHRHTGRSRRGQAGCGPPPCGPCVCPAARQCGGSRHAAWSHRGKEGCRDRPGGVRPAGPAGGGR